MASRLLPLIAINPNRLRNQRLVLQRLDIVAGHGEDREWSFLTADAGAIPWSAVIGKRTREYNYGKWLYVAALGHEDAVFLDVIYDMLMRIFNLDEALRTMQLPMEFVPNVHNKRDFVSFMEKVFVTYMARIAMLITIAPTT